MAKNEAMRRRVSRTENPPWVGGSGDRRRKLHAVCSRPEPFSLTLGAASGLLLLLPGPHPGERLARVDVGHRARLGVADRAGEALPPGRRLAQPLPEDG